jgi:hypothetical protein
MVLVTLFLQGSTHAMDVTIAWEVNTEAELAGYQVYYDTDPSAPTVPARTTMQPSTVLMEDRRGLR